MKIFISDLKTGDYINDQIFSLQEIQQHKTRTGNPYVSVRLVDKTGNVQAKIWENFFQETNVSSLQAGDVVTVSGKVQEFQGKTQLIIEQMEKVNEYDIEDLQKTSRLNIDDMLSQLLEKIKSVKDAAYKSLLDKLFSDEDFLNRLKRTPAAEKVHHDYVGGLLEHVLEMLGLAEVLEKFYPEANHDVLVTGIILHDIGKLWELESVGATTNRSIEGYLISHIPMGIEYVKDHLPKDFPKDHWMKLQHIILSHHTELENGAVVKPQTIEAIIVGMVDKTSSTVRQYQKALEESEGGDDAFSQYQKWIGVRVYRK